MPVLLPADFMFFANFPTLNALSPELQAAINSVGIAWFGALQLFAKLPQPVQAQKLNLLYNLLVAWYLASTDPGIVTGITSDPVPLSGKTVGGVSISRLEVTVQEEMKPLLTNTFGIQALQMMNSAGERFVLYG